MASQGPVLWTGGAQTQSCSPWNPREPWWLGWRRWRGRGRKNERRRRKNERQEREGGEGKGQDSKHCGEDLVAFRNQLRIAGLEDAGVYWGSGLLFHLMQLRSLSPTDGSALHSKLLSKLNVLVPVALPLRELSETPWLGPLRWSYAFPIATHLPAASLRPVQRVLAHRGRCQRAVPLPAPVRCRMRSGEETGPQAPSHSGVSKKLLAEGIDRALSGPLRIDSFSSPSPQREADGEGRVDKVSEPHPLLGPRARGHLSQQDHGQGELWGAPSPQCVGECCSQLRGSCPAARRLSEAKLWSSQLFPLLPSGKDSESSSQDAPATSQD